MDMRTQSFNRSNQASALIMVILMLALMVSVAVSFMNIVGRQQGTAVGVALQTHADLGLQQAQAHLTRTFVESIQDVKNNSGTSVAYTTAWNAPWRRQFDPLIDADADPWTEDDRTIKRMTGNGTLAPSTTTISAHPMINTKRRLFGMMGHHHGSYGDMITHVDEYWTRWHNHAWLTTDLKPIEIDPSLTEAEKVKLRKSARYVVRYTAQVYDTNGALNINNNYPDVLSSGTTTDRGPGPVDNLHYIRQQNYLKTYGRAIKSMSSSYYMFSNWGGSTQMRVQQRYDPNYTVVDPLDKETVSYREDGLSHSLQAYGELSRDTRLRMERGFRGGDLYFMNSSDWKTNSGNFFFFGTGHKGRIYTWEHINEVRMGASQGSPPYMFVPFADSMRDVDLADPGASVPVREVSTPWRVNMLSASNYTLRCMINGLSSEMRISRTKFNNADMFGLGYPEPFPLDFDAGRNIPLFSFDKPFTTDSGTPAIMQGGNGDDIYFNSYMLDVTTAFAHAMMQARRAWVTEAEVLSSKYSDGNTFIDQTATTNAGGEMLEMLLRETYRILGEHVTNGGATSLLSGDKSTIGSGSNACPLVADVQLHPGDDTRAMEYFLNDFMISLLGKSNPDPASFRVGDAVSDAIAVDFNGDGNVESSITGWVDSTTGNRTWSWWWDGLGPYVRLDANNQYMQHPGWYRFVAGDTTGGNLTPYRKVGSEWVAVPDVAKFYEYNDIWLNSGTNYPIKPFAKTGRMFIGKSRILYGFIRSEVYDILSQRVASAANRNFAFHVDPNEDLDFSDNTLLIQSEVKLIND